MKQIRFQRTGNRKFSKRIWRRRIRLLLEILVLVLAFLVQTSIFPLIPFLSSTPNLLLILTFSYGFLRGSMPGMIYGLFAGLLMDLFYSGPFGFYTLIFLSIGYANGFFNRFYYEEYLTLPVGMCIVSELLYHSYIYIFRFLIRAKFDLLYYFFHIVFPSIVFSVFVTMVLYRFVFTANEKLKE